MMKYLADTNVLSELAKSVPNQAVLEKFRQHRHETATASVVWHELRYGCCRLAVSRKRDALESFLDNVIRPHILILPYNLESAEWHGIERARLSMLGRPPSFADGQIAAITKVNKLILVTRNVSDFEAFEELEIENWHETVFRGE